MSSKQTCVLKLNKIWTAQYVIVHVYIIIGSIVVHLSVFNIIIDNWVPCLGSDQLISGVGGGRSDRDKIFSLE